MEIPSRLKDPRSWAVLGAALGLCAAGALAALAAAAWWPAAQDALGVVPVQRGIRLEPRAKFGGEAGTGAAEGRPEFPVTPEGRKLVANALAFHKVPGIIPAERRGEALCAGFDFALAEILWGKAAPYRIGMMDPRTKRPADAWDLPRSYAWYGGEVLADFSPELRTWRADYISHVETARWKDFFRAALAPATRLGDVGFLYRGTGYVAAMTGAYFNSHVGKVLGASDFSYPVPDGAGTGAAAVAAAIGCRPDFFEKLAPVLEHYAIALDGRPAAWRDGIPYADDGRGGWTPADPAPHSAVTLRDAAVAHFFQGQSRVDGLFSMACRGELLPANVMAVNPRLAGK